MKNELKRAIELAESGDWDGSHRIVQKIEDKLAYWLHASLHREEGDLSNAGYWYDRAERDIPLASVDDEREEIKTAVLD